MRAMIELQAVQIQRAGQVLLDNATFSLHAKQCMGIIGMNGCGKSSLFQVLLEQLSIDQGNIFIQPHCRIAHMAQEIQHTERSARDYVLDGFTLLRDLQADLALAEQTEDHLAISKALASLDEIEAYQSNHRAESILAGLGFSDDDYERAVSDFSGGWRIRLNLAQALFCPADLLLLDEPTNHLDIEAIQFLEQWLQRFTGAVLLISHDRDFIDSCCQRIAHIEQQQLTVYSGNYSAFERQRAEHIKQQESLQKQQQRREKELQQFIDRFKAKASKAKQAQSRIKALEKMQQIQVIRTQSPYQFQIPCSEKISSPLISWHAVDVGYQTQPILHQCQLSILPGQRLGLLGVNGAGKSTLIKTLAQSIPAIAGEQSQGEHLKLAYFAQHQLEALDLQASALLHIQRLSPDAREQEIRDFLGSFNIFGDKAVNPIAPFSGGEKARLALALIAWQKPNLLLLDEPTNHLDIAMREALADALQSYQGAVILVSHDRYLLRHCVDEFLLVENGQLQSFSGSLDDYYSLQEQQTKPSTKNPVGASPSNKKQARSDAAAKRKQLAPLKKKVDQLEKHIEDADQQLQQLRSQLGDAELYSDERKTELQSILAEEAKLVQQLADYEADWEQALEAFEAKQSD